MGNVASLKQRLPENVPGEFFVDSTCIDCDTCRQLAPEVFGETGEFSYVASQPGDQHAIRNALRALLACPAGSIGTVGPNQALEVRKDFPLELEPGLYYCGFNSSKSFGGNSYFLRHPDGNWLIDSPRHVNWLVRRFEEMGGIRHIFLTHRDDVADAARYAAHFHATRIIHRRELAAQPGAERVIEADSPIELSPGFAMIPTFGHTQGHCCLLHASRLLFTGDHLWWSRHLRHLNASRSVCWYSWKEQARSVDLLRQFTFEWVLPGHGERVHLAPDVMQREIQELSARLQPG